MMISEAVKSFVDYKRYFRRVQPQSAFAYAAHLRRFVVFAGDSELGFGIHKAEAYLIELSRRGCSENYMRKAFLILKDFSRWNHTRGNIAINPLGDAKAPMLHDRQKVFLSREEVARLLATIRRHHKRHALRDHAIAATLYYTLMRVSEAINARREDFDLPDCMVRVFGKGGKARAIPFHPRLRPILKEWLKSRPDGPTMFPSQRSPKGDTGIMNRERVCFSLREIYGPAAGLGRRVTPHALRRSGADHLYHGGADLGQIKGLLRHNSVSTTMTYLQVETPANLRGAWDHL